jgi:hypothetical protein
VQTLCAQKSTAKRRPGPIENATSVRVTDSYMHPLQTILCRLNVAQRPINCTPPRRIMNHHSHRQEHARHVPCRRESVPAAACGTSRPVTKSKYLTLHTATLPHCRQRNKLKRKLNGPTKPPKHLSRKKKKKKNSTAVRQKDGWLAVRVGGEALRIPSARV